MPIGINYNYTQIAWRKILPNYLLVGGATLEEIYNNSLDEKKYEDIILNEYILKRLYKDEGEYIKFSSPLVKDVLLEAYPYEINLKFMWDSIKNNETRNQNIMKLLNQYFWIDYKKLLETYNSCDVKSEKVNRFQKIRNIEYESLSEAVEKYTYFVHCFLSEMQLNEDANAIETFLKEQIQITFKNGISWITKYDWDTIYVLLWTMRYVTLFHELTHAVNKFFRRSRNQEINNPGYLTKMNEGFANFVSFNLFENITTWRVDINCSNYTEELFFSLYSEIYYRLYNYWNSEKNSNYKLVEATFKEFEKQSISNQKIFYFFERFYRYFHFNQHTYLYPKELLYYEWYINILNLFRSISNKWKMLAKLFLGYEVTPNDYS